MRLPTRAPFRLTRPKQPFQLDPQNVHQHSVSTILRSNAKALIKEGDGTPYDRVELIDEVMAKLRTIGITKQDEKKSFRVLVSLVPDMVSSIGGSQLDILDATFNKIKNIEDEEVKKNLFESLGKNLASGVERGNIVCSTGKIARIISTFEGVEPDVLGSTNLKKAIPMDTVRIEIGNLASKIRNDVMGEASEKERTDYNISDTSKLTNIMKDRFKNEVQKTYIDGLKLNKKIIDPISDLYGSAF